jgi:hypothetical protein
MNGSTIVSKEEEVVDRKRLSRGKRFQLFLFHYFFQTNKQTDKYAKKSHPCCKKFNKTFLKIEALTGYHL